jgi:hypothetical protein
MNRFKIIFSIFTAILFTQCMQDEYNLDKLDDDIEIRLGVLTPLAYGTLNFGDIVSEFDSSGFISTDADGLLLITYADSLFSFKADDLLEIPSQDFFQFFIDSDFGLPALPILDTFEINRTENFPFTFGNNERIDSMILDNGSINFNLTSTFLHTGRIDMVIPNLKLNGVAFTQSILIDVEDGTFSQNIEADLANYTLELNDSAGTDTMFFPVEFHVEIYTNGVSGVTVGDHVGIDAGLGDLDFEAIFGYIGDYELMSENGEIPLGFFETPIDGDIRFEDPRINLNIENSYGVPTAINISRFTGFNSSQDSIVMDLSAINPFGYAYPTISDYTNNDVLKDTTISINKDNSNISDFLAFLPSSFEYSLSAQSNPDGEGASYNFVSDDSEVNISLEFILPLWFSADNFAFVDTMDITFFEDADYVDKVGILLEVSNGLPLEIDFQVFFLDSAYNHIDSLFSEEYTPVISSATIDPSTSLVTAPGFKSSQVEFTNEDITKLEKVKYGIIRAGLKTSPDSNGDPLAVKFFTDYEIDFNLSVSIDIKASL